MDVLKILQILGIVQEQPKSHNVTFECPNCGRDKFNVNIQKGLYNCPACSQTFGSSGADPIALYAFIKDGKDTKKLSKSEKGAYYKEIKGIMRGGDIEEFDIPTSDDSDLADEERLNEVYRAFIKELHLSDYHFNELLKRGLSEKAIERSPYRTYPYGDDLNKIPDKLAKAGYNLEGVPGFYFESGKWKLKRYQGLLLFITNFRGNIVGAQVMNDYSSSAKYLWMSSRGSDKGSSPGTPVHMAGKPEAQVFLTEGSLKAQIAHELTGDTYIAVAGVNSLSYLPETLDYLKSVGVSKIVVAYDMDYEVNPNVQKALTRVEGMIKKDFEYSRYTWDSKYNGIDDYLWSIELEKIKNSGKKLPFRIGSNSVNPYRLIFN